MENAFPELIIDIFDYSEVEVIPKGCSFIRNFQSSLFKGKKQTTFFSPFNPCEI